MAAPAAGPPARPAWLQSAGRIAAVAAVTGVFLWSAAGINIDLDRILRGIPSLWRIIGLMIPPDWDWFGPSMGAMLQSFYIAVLGTTIGAVLAVPLGFWAAHNVTVYRALNVFARQLLNAIRTFPEIIMAVFFVAAYGPGPLAGVMAVGINSIGMLGKLYADVVENIERGPMEALTACGANRAQVMLYAVLPQVVPEFVATALYRFEINMRAAATLGLVGAGGIGVILLQSLQFRRWAVVGMALIVIVVVVTIIDYSSAYLRRRII